MDEKINIATLQIDVNQVEKKSVELRKTIESLKNAQKALNTTNDEGKAAYEALNSKIKNVTKEYKDNQKLAQSLDAANLDLQKTMSIQNKSTQELRDSRAQLNQISKQLGRGEGELTGNLEEELKLRDQLNAAIDDQTKALRGQGSQFNAGKDQIGEYEKGLGKTSLNLRVLIENSEKAGGSFNLLKGGLKAAKDGMISFTKSALAFILTPVGATLAIIAGAFLLIKNAMNRNEEAMTKVKSALGGLIGIFKGVLKVLEPLGKFMIDVLVKQFELVAAGLDKVTQGIAAGLEFLGFDNAAKSVKNFTNEIKESAKAGKELALAELEYEKAQRAARKTQLDYQRQAEKLRQIRDDESLSIKERIKANDELGATLKKQAEEELKLAEKALIVAQKRLVLDGQNKEALDELAQAETEIADIKERIIGQESEQLVNKMQLQKEAAQNAVKNQKAELDAFIKKNELIAKSLEENLRLERDIAEKKKEILKNELRNKLISRQEYDAQILSIDVDLAKKQAELTADNARRELEDFIKINKTKLDNNKFLTDEAVNEETRRLDLIAEKQREYEKKRLKSGIISQQEYNDAINAINEENEVKKQEAETAREEARKEKEAIDSENKLLLLELEGQNEFELRSQQLETSYLAEKEAAEKSGADKELIDKKYAARKKQLEDEINSRELQGYADVFDSYAEILGDQTAAGKTAAIAATTIKTYESATSAYSALAGIPIVGPGLGTAAAAAAVIAGLKNAKKIAATPVKFSKGDILKGPSHALKGIPFSIMGVPGFEAEGGEAIINKESTAMFAPLLSAINVAGGGKKFAVGGIAGQAETAIKSQLINYDLLASKVAEANQYLPRPTISVQEFNEVSSNLSVIEELATA